MRHIILISTAKIGPISKTVQLECSEHCGHKLFNVIVSDSLGNIYLDAMMGLFNQASALFIAEQAEIMRETAHHENY